MCVTRCENLVLEAVESSPLVFSLLSALERAGCPFSVGRHVACEPLPPGMLGGFDKDLNQVLGVSEQLGIVGSLLMVTIQVVICSNKCRDLERVTRILTHELVHMFDDCTAMVDWANLRHLACSEVPSSCTCFKKVECIL